MSFELFGTITSPFVRRVRVVAIEKNIPFTLVDTFTPEGQARMRSLSPVWKVPTARFADGTVVWDSRVIVDALCRDTYAPLRPMPTSLAERADEENVIHAIDEALLSLIRRFYLKKEGASLDAPWHHKELARAESICTFVANRVREDRYVGPFGAGHGFGVSELAVFSALGWMRFRDVIDLSRWPKLVAFEKSWAERPSLAQTRPA